MIYGEGVQKISLVSEPLAYVQPVHNQAQAATINKVVGFDNYFNHEKYYDVVKKRHNTYENPLFSRNSTKGRGQIFDFKWVL